ncbi:MAG: 1-acyl-sn-glycerol-3-phosphate acyltransferase [Actinomycetales bacterium]|nr:1-acyl-sn-glycerol-3-phosphate acyltransferase [Actinomycetales bacterium]
MAQHGRRYTSPGRTAARYVAQRGILKPTVWSVVSPTIIGRERLKKLPKAFVVVANHTSHLDAPLIVTGLPYKYARYLATGAAADYFFDVWWRRGLTGLFFNAFPVDRTGSNPKSMSARTLLEKGVPLLVFPEGTRSKDGTIAPFKSGAAAIASSAGAPILPLAIIGAYEAHPRGSSWPKRGRLPVGLVCGDPMYAREGETAQQFMARVREEVIRLYDTHRDDILGSPEDQAAGEGTAS